MQLLQSERKSRSDLPGVNGFVKMREWRESFLRTRRLGRRFRDSFVVRRLHQWVTAQRLTACLLLVVTVWMLFPLQFELGIASSGNDSQGKFLQGKDEAVAFPCQNRPCGCKTADHCWKKCCCFTNAQKVAWAKHRGVKLPEFVILAAAEESRRPAQDEACCLHSPDKEKKDVSRQRGTFVIALDQLGCSGINATVCGMPVCVPPCELISAKLCDDGCETDCDWSVSVLSPCWREPPTPPPRIVS